MNIKNNFLQGKMNKDLDERLLPKGQYTHAENIRVANSEGSDIGAIENTLGNLKLTDFNLVDPKTIGSYVDSSNQKIYWFTTSENKDLVVEYDFPTQVTSVLLEDTRGILNFSRDFLITGIVKIYNEDFRKDLLIWTDDLNPPRAINIERSKNYGADGFNKDQITLIKKPPFKSPEFDFTFDSRSSSDAFASKFLAFSYRYIYRDGERSALAPFSYYAYSPNELDIDFDTLENRGMVNNFNALDITFETGTEEVREIELVFKEANSNTVYSIESFNKDNMSEIEDNSTFRYRFINDKVYAALPNDELFRLFDNVPNKAKALDLVGSRLVFGNYEEGFDIKNEAEQDIDIDYSVEVVSEDIAENELPSNLLGDSMDIDFSVVNLQVGSRIDFRLDLEEYDENGQLLVTSSYFNDTTYIINEQVSSVNELLNLDTFRFFIEQSLTSIFNTNSTGVPPDSNVAPTNRTGFRYQVNGNSIRLFAPFTDYTIDTTPSETGDNPASFRTATQRWRFAPRTSITTSLISTLASVKSFRSYEVGLVYLDEYGRSSTVLTSKTNTIDVPPERSITKNQLQVTLNHKPPKDAVAYRYAIKQTKGKYDNIFAVNFFEEGEFVWIKLEGSDIDKVNVGDSLIAKSDTTGVLFSAPEVSVLEKVNKGRNFISGNGFDPATGEIIEGVADDAINAIIEPEGVYIKIKPIGFDMTYNALTFLTERFHDANDDHRPSVNINPFRGDNPFPISQSASVKITIFSHVERRSERLNYEANYTSSQPYDSFFEFYRNEVGFRDVPIPDSNRLFTIEDSGDGRVKFITPLSGDGDRRTADIIVNITIRNRDNLTVFETKPLNNNEAVFFESAETFNIINGQHQGNIINQTNGQPTISKLEWFNTFSLGEGVESISYLDRFNSNYLNADLRPNAVSLQGFGKIRKFADLTYSEPYVENTSFNGLNEFNLFRANFKEDIDKKYGFIQKVYTRDTDLVVFQEDKVHKVLFGKDLLVNSDGSSNVTSTEQVLGQHIAYTGEYGISRNPESFAFDAKNLYFTDAKRGSVMRLGNDGLTEISNYGMRRYFKEEFRQSLINKKVGAFDPFHDQYVLNLSNDTLSNPITIGCGETFRQTNFSGTLNHILDLGVLQGETGVSFSTNGVPLKVSIEWNGQVYDSGLVSDTNTYNITFNKNSSLPSTANLKIETTECDASITLQNICVVSPPITVVSIVLNDEKDEDLERISRYRWVNGNYESRYKVFNSLFEGDTNINIQGRDAKVDIFNIDSGNQGVNFLPIEGSTIILESLNSPNDTAKFIEGDRLGYLITDTEYTESQIQDIINNATFLTPINGTIVNGDPLKATSFTLPTTNNRYVYLIWDYILKNEAPTANKDFVDVNNLGGTAVFDIVANDTDPDGDALVIGDIVNPPLHGTVSVNGRFITYTHNGSDNVDDEFTYRVFDGLEYSQPATVCVSVGVPCSGQINAAGESGVYEVNINIGTATGLTGINYEAFQIRDRFQIEYDGQIVADTNYVGSRTLPIGTFNLPVFDYQNGAFVNTGQTRSITTDNSQVGGQGNGVLTFNKTSRTPTRMKIIVTGVDGSTRWNLQGICPS